MDLDSSPITCSFAVNGGSATTYTSDNLSYNYNNLIPGRTYGFAAADAQSGTINIQFTFNFKIQHSVDKQQQEHSQTVTVKDSSSMNLQLVS